MLQTYILIALLLTVLFSFSVCFDVGISQQCVDTINAGDDCSSSFMKSQCKKSCRLCPGKGYFYTEKVRVLW